MGTCICSSIDKKVGEIEILKTEADYGNGKSAYKLAMLYKNGYSLTEKGCCCFKIFIKNDSTCINDNCIVIVNRSQTLYHNYINIADNNGYKKASKRILKQEDFLLSKYKLESLNPKLFRKIANLNR